MRASHPGQAQPTFDAEHQKDRGAPFVSVAVRVKPVASDTSVIAWAQPRKDASSESEERVLCCDRGCGVVQEYEFSRVFGPEDDNRCLFGDLQSSALVSSVFAGVNETIFAYGQTGSGKTHTIFGTGEEPGLLQYFVREIFEQAEQSPGSTVHVCCYEIFGDALTDLIDTGSFVAQGELRPQDVVFDELFLKTQKYRYQIVHVSCLSTCLELLRTAQENRATGTSSNNATSSRSHAIVHVFVQNPVAIAGSQVHTPEAGNEGACVGALSLVDLAGAEKEYENPSEQGRKTTRLLNASLSSLNRLLRKLQTNSLNESERRQSVLCKCLWEYLRPGCGIALIFCVSSLPRHREATFLTLAMAADSKLIHSRRRAMIFPNMTEEGLRRPSTPGSASSASRASGGRSCASSSAPVTPVRSPMRSRPRSTGAVTPEKYSPARLKASSRYLAHGDEAAFLDGTLVYEDGNASSSAGEAGDSEISHPPARTASKEGNWSSSGCLSAAGSTSTVDSERLRGMNYRRSRSKGAAPRSAKESASEVALDLESATVTGTGSEAELSRLRQELRLTRARSQERIGQVEQGLTRLCAENTLLRTEYETLRALYIRQQKQHIDFWKGPYKTMFVPQERTRSKSREGVDNGHVSSARRKESPVLASTAKASEGLDKTDRKSVV